MQSQNRTRLFLLFGSAGFLVLAVLTIFLLRHSAKPTAGSTGTYLDPFSHETLSNPPGKTPENYRTNADIPTFLGFDKLIDHGMSFSQVGNLKTAFYNYSKSRPTALKEISVDVDHISDQHDSSISGSPFYLLFKVMFDRKDVYQAKVDYSGLDTVRLYLTDSNNKSIYDSQVVGP